MSYIFGSRIYKPMNMRELTIFSIPTGVKARPLAASHPNPPVPIDLKHPDSATARYHALTNPPTKGTTMTTRLLQSICLFACVIAASTTTRADVKLPAIIGDNMVVQQGKPVAIWGWADVGEEVTVTLPGAKLAEGVNLGQVIPADSPLKELRTKLNVRVDPNVNIQSKATADAKGQWQVKLPALAYGGPHTITIQGKNKIEIKNVMVGEVWLCSGQSNMAWTLSKADNADKEVAAANHPKIRLISVPRNPQDKPQDNFKGQWVECDAKAAAGFSAVGYYFGRELHQKLNVAIGLIDSSFGGTPAEAWTSRASLEAVTEFKPLLEKWDKDVASTTPESIEKKNNELLAKWKLDAETAKKDGKPAPVKPRLLTLPGLSQNRPANLYNGMIAPLLPYAIRGSIWYQGESNCPRAHQYRTLFPAMIENWRKDFANAGGDLPFPFYFVQLAPFRYTRNDPALCAELWEAQLLTLKNVKNTGMAVITDIGDVKDIHPTNKLDVGRRLSLWALAKTYGHKNVVYSGPIYKSHKIDGDKIVIEFDEALTDSTRGLKSRDGKPLTHFEIAGEDQKFVAADAKFEGNTIFVSAKDVKKPAAVRFAWRDDAEPNLVNEAGLPASPFRTDAWKGLTEGKAF